MADEFPYTDEQVHQFATLDPDWVGEADGHTGYARTYLMYLHNAGIIVLFPEPRYVVRQVGENEEVYGIWAVFDQQGLGVGWVAEYSSQHPNPEAARQGRGRPPEQGHVMRSLPTAIVTSVHDRICDHAHDWSGCDAAPWWDIYHHITRSILAAVEPIAEAKTYADEANKVMEDAMLDLRTEVGP